MNSSATNFAAVVNTTNGRRPVFANLSTKGSFLKRTVLSLSVLAFLGFDASAANFTSAKSGNWNDPTTWGGASVPGSSDNVTISGNFTVTVDIASATCSTLQVGPTSGNSTGTLAFNSGSQLTVGSGGATLGGGGGRTGTLDMTNGGTLIIGTGSSLTNSGPSGFTAGSGTVVFNGAAQTVPALSSAYNNLTLGGSGAKTTTGITVNGTMSLQGTATSGAITYGSSATLEYKGSSAQTVGSEFSATMPNVIVNNANGVTLGSAKTISGTLTLTSGKLNISGGGLTVSSNATSAVSASSSNYIVVGATSGLLRYSSMTQNSTYTFPIGTSTYYLPVTVKPTTAAGDFSVGVFTGITMNAQPSGTAYDANSKKSMVDAVWGITRNSGTSSGLISLTWDPALEGSSIAGSSGNAIGISQYSSGWQTSQANAANTTTTANATFSSFTQFGVTRAAVPLAIELQYFNGSVANGNANLQWAMGNNEARQIFLEKGTDGKTFGTLAAITINGTNVYEYKDPMGAGANNYYRLKMVEANGNVTYSNVVNLKTNKFGSTPITISPNPAKDNITVVFPLNASESTLMVVDMQGRTVIKQVISANTDQGDVNISSLPAGIYTLRVDAGNTQVQQLFYHQ